MQQLPFSSVFRMAVVAGVVAGLLLGGFHLLATEPTIDAAIAIEEGKTAARGEMEEPVVSRETQRVGLVAGFGLYGLSLGLLFCGAFYLVRRALPALAPGKQGALLGVMGYWCLALAPFLKYPANPPGVGDPDTIQMRQAIALAYMALLLAGAAVSVYLARRQVMAPWRLVAANVAFAAVLWAVMPANPDPVEMPGGLVLQFRALSLLGLTLFWAALTGLFAWQIRPRHGLGSARPSTLPDQSPA